MGQPVRRGYALILVLMVLALLSIGLGTLFIYQESSARISGNLVERRRVFYACDGISRAATVLAQNYAQTAQPTTAGLINAVCDSGGGGCCATKSSTAANPTAGTCDAASPLTQFTRLKSDPKGSGTTALPKIVPAGYKVMELALESIAKACLADSECGDGGTCVASRCRTVAPLPNGPFQGMSARQDTITFALAAEHRATSGFRCQTRQTLTLGKIAMFQFFLFSDSATTDWHPGPAMRASGRLHANGDLHISGKLMLQRMTASGDIRKFNVTGDPCLGEGCSSPDTQVARVGTPDFNNPADFAPFARSDSNWRQSALTKWGGNVLDRAHAVPRLQLPIVGQPRVQRGYDGLNVVIPNTNAASGAALANARLLVDPVLVDDAADIIAQKFSAKADIRIINGIWYLNTPGSLWPGKPIWSDHGTYTTTKEADFVADVPAGQSQLRAEWSWGSYTPQRYSYYGMKPGLSELELDDPQAARPSVRAVISYGALFRETTEGEHAPTWRPGVRTLQSAGSESWCEDQPAGLQDVSHVMLDALALDGAGSPCPAGFGRAAGVLSAARSGFRDGFAEFALCKDDDRDEQDPTCSADRREANILPLNFDVGALQQALADTTRGELGSFFCASGACEMRRPFNGIVWISNPYPGSEDGYGTDGGVDVPAKMPAPTMTNNALIDTVTLATLESETTPTAFGNWGAAPLALLRNNPQQPDAARTKGRDDEVLALPWPLCSDVGGSGDLGAAGTTMSTRGWTYRRPECGAAATPSSWLSGVRIINARVVNARQASATPPATIIAEAGKIKPFTKAEATAQLPDIVIADGSTADSSGRLPAGLSLVTNHPLYVLGDVNITSDAFDLTGEAPWVPVLLSGDTIHPSSNDWDDRKARWAVSTGSPLAPSGKIGTMNGTAFTKSAATDAPRPAQVTRWYMQVLSGWGLPVKGAPATGIHNYPFFNENWTSGATAACGGTGDFTGGCPAILYGSLVIGHNRVYTRWPFADEGNITRTPPRRDWGFDTHLNDLDKQPPGAPIFDVSAVKQWSRE